LRFQTLIKKKFIKKIWFHIIFYELAELITNSLFNKICVFLSENFTKESFNSIFSVNLIFYTYVFEAEKNVRKTLAHPWFYQSMFTKHFFIRIDCKGKAESTVNLLQSSLCEGSVSDLVRTISQPFIYLFVIPSFE